MSQEIEIEFKNLLMVDEFSTLTEAFHIKEEDFITQHNDYFDTPSFDLKAKGAALRIREKQGKFVLTLKQTGEVGLIETHQSLTPIEAKKVLDGGLPPQGEVLHVLQGLSIPVHELGHLGRLTTQRAETDYLDGLLVFDHSFYGQHEDYELEYEVKDPIQGEKVFKNLLVEYTIPVRPTENKIRRLMNAIS